MSRTARRLSDSASIDNLLTKAVTDHLFCSWRATQSYSVEVAIGTIFAVVIAPAVLVGMASLVTLAERPIGELLRMSGLLNPLKRGNKNLWWLHPTRHLAMWTRQPIRDQLGYGLGLAAPTQSGKR